MKMSHFLPHIRRDSIDFVYFQFPKWIFSRHFLLVQREITSHLTFEPIFSCFFFFANVKIIFKQVINRNYKMFVSIIDASILTAGWWICLVFLRRLSLSTNKIRNERIQSRDQQTLTALFNCQYAQSSASESIHLCAILNVHKHLICLFYEPS